MAFDLIPLQIIALLNNFTATIRSRQTISRNRLAADFRCQMIFYRVIFASGHAVFLYPRGNQLVKNDKVLRLTHLIFRREIVPLQIKGRMRQ